MSSIDVTTRADGFGLWHARVTERGVGDAEAARERARTAIIAKLSQREGPSFAPSSVGVVLESRTSRWGVLVSEFREVDA